MSFSQEVKKEITTVETNLEGYKAELYGISKLKSNLVLSNRLLDLEYVTNNITIARRIVTLLKKIFGADVEILTKEQNKLDYKKLYYITVKGKAKEILTELDILDENFNFKEDISPIYDNQKPSVLRGMFLARGSINDPNKSHYHLEIVCNEDSECQYIMNTLSDFGIAPKMIERRKGLVVYLKKSEHIGDFLKFIGATSLLFYFENERIKRDLNNVVNRVMNCDVANTDRLLKTASRQLETIELIESKMDITTLSQRLQDAIYLRKENPDSSLSELSEISEDLIGKNISKSGLSHCFKDLDNIALGLKK